MRYPIDPPAGLAKTPAPLSIQESALTHQLRNLRTLIDLRDRRRVRLHLVMFTLAGVISIWLILVHLDIAGASVTGMAPVLAETLDRWLGV